ncbi:MAG: MBL fold metallo-hydrolase [Candidatus Andeanibacterium colombiense]|uniref:MBL fold metallo-hydrolase n=1 Tax=Candidatus Andeanibacterium colombiense TaxID=3121345 RepID=A0AAJ5X2K5_9SPHN|nr:MAG: MBL fold metallo-hydrolase [Sphingomonadaceae bacterium]
MQKQRLGHITVSKVVEAEDGVPLPMIFPAIAAADLERVGRWYADPELTSDPETSKIVLSMHSFVIEIGGQNILVDACNGDDKQRCIPSVHLQKSPYLANLAAQGFKPEDIHMVLCTHLHFDHVGWNTRLDNGRWVPTFPNARYIFGRRDYDHFASEAAELPHREAYADSVLPVVQAGQAEIVDLEGPAAALREIGDGVWLEPAFGHSPGSCLVKAQSGGDEALFWGDVIHHPVQLARPELTLPFDFDQPLAARVRQDVLERIADTGTMCFPAHFRGQTAGRVHRDGDAYRYEFVE